MILPIRGIVLQLGANANTDHFAAKVAQLGVCSLVSFMLLKQKQHLMQKEKTRQVIDLAGLIGSSDWTRTSDPLINSQLLYQLSYRGSEPSQK